MFEFDLTDELRRTLEKLSKKNKVIAKSVNNKIKEIIYRDEDSIKNYKNLRYDLKNLKRAHITNWLVLTFKVNIEENFILFVKLEHRDNIYKKK